MNIKQKLATGAATIALLGSVMSASAFADTTIDVSGNGGHSDNDVHVTNSNTTEVTQTNHSAVLTFVDSSADTGGNKANGNVGGTNSISTGDATSKVNVTVNGNSNTANVDPCECQTDGNTDVTISGNGKHSDNDVKVKNKNKTKVTQDNSSFVLTGIKSKAKTGHNSTSWNVGSGDEITSGDAKSKVHVTVNQGSNTLNP